MLLPYHACRAPRWHSPALLRLAALATLAVTLGACADSPTAPRDDQARLTVSAAVAGTPITTIVITVSATDIARPLVFNLTVHDGVATGTLHVPPGLARLFSAQGFDAAGEVTHEGATTAAVRKGDNPALAIAMLPRTGHVPITITIGSVNVVVTPSSVALIEGATQQLAAAVTYEGGQAVPGAVPVWASSNPAVASVDQGGLVTAHTAGQAQIMAVFAGSGGASAVAVSVAQIAFVSQRDNSFGEIFVMNPDGTGETRLTNNGAGEFQPAWSPDRARIAFVSRRDAHYSENNEIYVMNADGTGQTRLTNNAAWNGYPAWSPDGRRIAFIDARDLNWNIYVMNANGTGETRLTETLVLERKRSPAWSPNGANIAFSSDRDGNTNIWVVGADGTGMTRLTDDASSDDSPSWSPDGARIAFTSDREGVRKIYIMNADGSAQKRLTNGQVGEGPPAWSPNGAQIAFSSDQDGNPEIYVMNADGTAQTRLTNNTVPDFWPAWR